MTIARGVTRATLCFQQHIHISAHCNSSHNNIMAAADDFPRSGSWEPGKYCVCVKRARVVTTAKLRNQLTKATIRGPFHAELVPPPFQLSKVMPKSAD